MSIGQQHSLCRLPGIPMMQSAQARGRDYRAFRRRLLFGRPVIGRFFAEAVVNSIIVIVIHVISDQPAKMWFVQRNYVVGDLSPATPHPSFRTSILPRRLYARSFGLQSCCLQESDYFIECGISIEDGVSIRTRFGESLAQLLHDPLRCRVAGHAKMQNLAPPVRDPKEAGTATGTSPLVP